MAVPQPDQPFLTTGVHLVGSIPLANASTVFTTVLKSIPNRLRRIPDGETGTRSYFGRWQVAVFQNSPFVLRAQGLQTQSHNELIAAPVDQKITVLPTGYDDAAIDSYHEFCAAREQGHVPPGVRFQVSLPTPLNIIAGCIRGEYQIQCEELYKERLLASLRRIQDEIPGSDLAIQWDTPIEFVMLEKFGAPFLPWFSPVQEGIVERFVALAMNVDDGVEMGFHFCYGDLNHVHFVQPKDMGRMVEKANLLKEKVKRRIHWLHMPVPKDRTDKGYFEPLKDLELGNTELYLGLVHADDEEGTRRRIDVAAQFVGEFGVGTECGLGRTPAEQLESIFRISALNSTPVT